MHALSYTSGTRSKVLSTPFHQSASSQSEAIGRGIRVSCIPFITIQPNHRSVLYDFSFLSPCPQSKWDLRRKMQGMACYQVSEFTFIREQWLNPWTIAQPWPSSFPTSCALVMTEWSRLLFFFSCLWIPQLTVKILLGYRGYTSAEFLWSLYASAFTISLHFHM